ncbi:MAG: efflux RND transporter periplasmic adaptor subunit [Gammaproteobacteria bacterium]|nr:efflux RND transporter periplasmic adaptor subunit [Gammaproteobacteria bacterium]
MAAHEQQRPWWLPGRARWWFFVPIGLGLIVLMIALLLAPGAPRGREGRAAPLVRVVTVTPADVTPRLTGYGEIRAEHTWQAVAQVPGRMTWRHPELRPGARFPAGTRLVEIDPHDYELAVSRAESQHRAAAAARAELEARARNLAESRNIESYGRAATSNAATKLAAGGHIAAVELDAERRQLLRQRQTLQSLETELNLLPAQRDAVEARLREATLQLDGARRNLERTRLEMPFDGRVIDVSAELSQFVPAGQTVFTAATTEQLEALLEVPVEQLVSRFPGILGAAGPAALPDITAALSWAAGDVAFHWQGRVVRVDPALDAQTRAARVFIAVTGADAVLPAGNVFARIELSGPVLPKRLSVPRLAVEDDQVWLVDDEDRLVHRAVQVAFRDDQRAVIAEGLTAGDRVMVSRVPFAEPGMAVEVAPPS